MDGLKLDLANLGNWLHSLDHRAALLQRLVQPQPLRRAVEAANSIRRPATTARCLPASTMPPYQRKSQLSNNWYTLL